MTRNFLIYLCNTKTSRCSCYASGFEFLASFRRPIFDIEKLPKLKELEAVGPISVVPVFVDFMQQENEDL